MDKFTTKYVGPHGINIWFHKFNNEFTKEMSKKWARDKCVSSLNLNTPVRAYLTHIICRSITTVMKDFKLTRVSKLPFKATNSFYMKLF